jgi:undecaprenyl diphosphate synthase
MKTDHTLDYQILELLLRLEVPNVTVYAFAIGNFKRPPEEVSKLMDLARTKLVQICEKGYDMKWILCHKTLIVVVSVR